MIKQEKVATTSYFLNFVLEFLSRFHWNQVIVCSQKENGRWKAFMDVVHRRKLHVSISNSLKAITAYSVVNDRIEQD